MSQVRWFFHNVPDYPFIYAGEDYAQHFLYDVNVTAMRNARETDNNRIAGAVGAAIVNREEDRRESDVGTKCVLFNVEQSCD